MEEKEEEFLAASQTFSGEQWGGKQQVWETTSPTIPFPMKNNPTTACTKLLVISLDEFGKREITERATNLIHTYLFSSPKHF